MIPSAMALICRSDPPEQMTKASASVVSSPRSSSTMSAAFLSSASSTMRRARSSGARSVGGAAASRCGRPSGRWVAVVGRGRSRGLGPPGGFGVELMVVDVAGDRVRHEVAHGAADGGPSSHHATRDGQEGPGRNGDAVLAAREALRDPGAVERLVAAARHDGEAAQVEDPVRLAPGRELGERLGREDEPGLARRPRRRSASSVSTVYEAPPRSTSIRLTAKAGLPAIASSTIASRWRGVA